VIIGHLAIDRTAVGPIDFEVPGDVKLGAFKKALPPVFLGHYHMHREIKERPRVTYIGSLLQHTWGERKEIPGFVVFDVERKKCEFVSNKKSPRFRKIDLRIRCPKKRPSKKDFVRVVLDSLDDLPKGWSALPHMDIIEKQPFVKSADENFAESESLSDLLREYLAVNPPEEGLDVDDLVKLGVSLVQEVQV
jgi:DNA repair exonuclease SbcCD nuclease subunit